MPRFFKEHGLLAIIKPHSAEETPLNAFLVKQNLGFRVWDLPGCEEQTFAAEFVHFPDGSDRYEVLALVREAGPDGSVRSSQSHSGEGSTMEAAIIELCRTSGGRRLYYSRIVDHAVRDVFFEIPEGLA